MSMRAAYISRALAKRFEVRLAVLSPEPPPEGLATDAPWLEAWEALPALADTHYRLISLVADTRMRLRAFAAYPRPLDSCLVSPAAVDRVAELAHSVEHVHVMRLYLAPLVGQIERDRLRLLTLDSDDDDAAYHRRRHVALDPVQAEDERTFEQSEAVKYDQMKAEWLPRFDRVFVAAEREIDGMTGAVGVSCLPNIAQGRTLPAGARSDVLRLTFVGSLGYPPNAQAVRWLSNRLSPALERLGAGPFEIAVCGSGLVETTGLNPHLSLRGYVEDLDEIYASSDVVLVPLSFGSGTPLKLLEAMALGVPVVASSFAAAAVGALHGEHLLVADGAEEAANFCIALKHDEALRKRLTAAARRLVEARFSREALDAAVDAAFDQLALKRRTETVLVDEQTRAS